MAAVIFRLNHYKTCEVFEPLNLLKGLVVEDAIQRPPPV
jgi:hypothetical protein